jgi:1-hydroxycarotenoid 3,4-desaturase
MTEPHRVVVVGAGMGGLVAALKLAHGGMHVTVVERAAQAGGKLREVMVGDAAIDAGPTVFTMRWVFEELMQSIGEDLSACLPLQRAEVLARHAWRGGACLDLYADMRRTVDAISAFSSPAEGARYQAFCERTQRITQALEKSFLRGSKPNPVSLMWRSGLQGLTSVGDIAPWSTMWRELGRHFDDPRLRQLFGRYATYCGSSPFEAPATLMLVAHVEREGVWLVDGGMRRIAACLQRLAEARGAQFLLGQGVTEVLQDGGRAVGVRLQSGDTLRAGSVVFNGDVAAVARGLQGLNGDPPRPQGPLTSGSVAVGTRSLAALTWHLKAPAYGMPLSRHNVLFSDDYTAEFDDLRRHARLPQQPTAYVCASDRSAADADDVATSSAPQRLMVLVNAPPLGDGVAGSEDDAFTSDQVNACREATFAQMARCGLTIPFDGATSVTTTPRDFARLFPATGGALYGQASHGWLASFTRPGSRSALPGLYLAGGSTHPGPGVPMAALSGVQAAASVLADSPSGARKRA